MELITQDVIKMIRVFLINSIIILFYSSKSLIAADMSGYFI